MTQENNEMVDNPEFQAMVRALIEDRIPFSKLLGMKLTSFDPAHPEMRLTMQDQLLGNFAHGMLHGGVIASLLDMVGGFAVLLKLAKETPKDTVMGQVLEFAHVSTIDLRVDYLRPGRGQEFVATAEVTRLGSRVANVLMNLQNENGERIATGAAAFMLHSRR